MHSEAKYRIEITHAPNADGDRVPWRTIVEGLNGAKVIGTSGMPVDSTVTFGETRDDAIERAEAIVKLSEAAASRTPETLYYNAQAEQVPALHSVKS